MDLQDFDMQFVKAYLKGKKKFLKKSQVRPVDAPRFREITVDKLYTLIGGDAGVLEYLPDKKEPPHKQPPREFVLNVLNTIVPDFVEHLVEE